MANNVEPTPPHLFHLAVLPVGDVVSGEDVNIPEFWDHEHWVFNADVDGCPIGEERDVGWTDDGWGERFFQTMK